MNTKIVNHSKKDDAVSPVVGVMLMLVVTIVIAAVVALFATSVVTDMDAAPVAVIQMDAYDGNPEVNQNLCMSIIGGKALELSKLKCVVTIEDGKYGLVFKSLDTDTNVGKFLEIGEKLEIFNLDSKDGKDGGMRKINSVVGGAYPGDLYKIFNTVKSYWEVGNKVNVMIVYNEDAILYKRDIIIQDGNRGNAVTIDQTSSDATWTTPSSMLMTWSTSDVTVSPSNGDSWEVTIEESSSSNGSSSDAIVLTVAPASGKTLNGIDVTDSSGKTLILDADKKTTGTFSGSLTLTAKVGGAPTGKNIFALGWQNGTGDLGFTTFTVNGNTVHLVEDMSVANADDIGVLAADTKYTVSKTGGAAFSDYADISAAVETKGGSESATIGDITADSFTISISSEYLDNIKEGSSSEAGKFNLSFLFTLEE